jgi:hypothetical protein
MMFGNCSGRFSENIPDSSQEKLKTFPSRFARDGFLNRSCAIRLLPEFLERHSELSVIEVLAKGSIAHHLRAI